MNINACVRRVVRIARLVSICAIVISFAIQLSARCETAGGANDDVADALAKAILDKAGIRVGVCEMPRVGDGNLAAALAKQGVTLVHGLAADLASAESAREPADGRGVLGVKVIIEPGDPMAIPLADWVADLVVVADLTDLNLKALSSAEIQRVVAPYRGVAILGNPNGAKSGLSKAALEAWAKGLDGKWTVTEDASGLWAVVKAPPLAGGDEWTHFGHDGGNNPVSTDTVFKLHDDPQPQAAAGSKFAREGKGRNFTLSAKIDASAADAAPEAIYQALRLGTTTYTVNGLKANAEYTARFHFVEPWETAAGRRVMDVTVNGQPALTQFDIFAAGGQNKAVVRDVSAHADAKGELAILFSAANGAVVSGIEIRDGGTPVLKIHAGGSPKDGFVGDVDAAEASPAGVLVQYVTPPKIGAGGSARVAGGRMFEAQGQQHKYNSVASLAGWLWCRSASNGQILWKTKLPGMIEAKQMGVFVATVDAVYMIDEDRPGVQVIDAETGKQIRVIKFADAAGQCKWLAIDNGILYALFGDPAPALPPAASYSWPGVPKKIMEGKLRHGKTLCAYDLAADKPLWSHTETPNLIDCRGVGVWSGQICFFSEQPEFQPWQPDPFLQQSSRATTAQKNDMCCEPVAGVHLCCLDGRTGKTLWENKDDLKNLNRNYQFIFGREFAPEMICSPDGIRFRMIAIYRNDAYCFDPATGKLRWKMTDGVAGFFKNGQYCNGGAWDASTGKLVSEKLTWDSGCGVRTASPAGIFGNVNTQSIGMTTKSDCHMGSFVAEGLLNVASGWCMCEPVWRGTWAFSSRGSVDIAAVAGPDRVFRAANVPPRATAIVSSVEDWPVYRHDNERSAASPVSITDEGRILWQSKPAVQYEFATEHDIYSVNKQDQPTEPVTAGDSIYFGGSDGKIECLDAASGKTRWRFWTAGRVYAPPTIWSGRVLAGSMDGQVYCLAAATGELVWRFRCAPADQRVMIADHLVSRWPVQGGVLVMPALGGETGKGIVYAVSGITDVMGAQVYALDADTGQVVWQDTHAGEQKGNGQTRNIQEGLTPDGFMTVSQGRLFVRNRFNLAKSYDLASGQPAPAPVRLSVDVHYGPAGREIASLGNGWILEGGRMLQHEQNQRDGDRNYFSFDLKQYSAQGLPIKQVRIKYSGTAILPPAFDRDLFVAVSGGWSQHADANGKWVMRSIGPNGTLGLMAIDKSKFIDMVQAAADKMPEFNGDVWQKPAMNWLAVNGESALKGNDPIPDFPALLKKTPAFRWEYADPAVQINALALAKNAVLITYGVQKHDPKDKARLIDDFSVWKVASLDRSDGHTLWEQELSCEPVLCSLAVDRAGRVIVTLRDGSVVCVGATNTVSK